MMSRYARYLYWWTLAAIMVPNVALCFTERMTLLQNVTNIVLPLGVVWLLMTVTRRVGLSVWGMFVLIFLAAFEIVLLSLYGRSVISVDMYLNVVTTNTTEVTELLRGLLPAVIIAAALYLPPLVMGCIAIARGWRITERMYHCCRRGARLVCGLGIILFGLCLVSAAPYRPLRQLYPLNAIYNLVLAVERAYAQRDYPASAGDYRFDARPTDSLPELTMIVIGETSRASHWQLLGYGRPTTPRLSSRDDIIAFPRALSQSNTTHKSVPLMLTHLDATQFGDSIYKVKGIISAFREAGIPTVFISNQQRAGALIDCFGEEADTAIFIADTKPTGRTDLDLLPVVGSILESHTSGSGKLLMVIHTYGSHYEYDDRYPAAMGRFRPDRPLHASPESRERLVNAYDNTICLTDYLLTALMGTADRHSHSASLIYTSDHGEDIYDDSRGLFLHASPIPSYEQLHVPMIIWMNSNYRAAHPRRYLAALANRRRPVTTSAALFHTAMEMAGIESPRVKPELSLVSNRYVPVPYRYLDDHNEAATPVEARFDQCDIERIDTLYTSRLKPISIVRTR